jgi:Zn-dependent protease
MIIRGCNAIIHRCSRCPQHDDSSRNRQEHAGTTIAYAIVQTGVANLLSPHFIEQLLVASIVCGVGFVVHEVAHRQVARHFGASAHFAADNRWLILSLLIAFAGIFIAAPGAVWHTGVNDKRRLGLIALAGPLSNLLLAVGFLSLDPVAFLLGWDFDLLYVILYGGGGL